MEDTSKVKVGLEATGYYSYNLLGYLIDKSLTASYLNDQLVCHSLNHVNFSTP